MTTKQHIAHGLAAALAITAGVAVEVLTSSPYAHAAWAPAALVVAKYLVSALGTQGAPPAAATK